MIKLENISAGYGNGDVLQNVSYTLPEGKSLAVLGPNGCGKTTLLRVIAGLLPYKGEVTACGIKIKTAPRLDIAKKIALMGQTPFATFGFTVREAVIMGRYAHRERGLFSSFTKRDEEIADECLEAVGLTQLQSKSITELSGGQLQRVFLARTLCQQPQIILLDEPTNHMDLKHQAELVDYLAKWSREKDHTVISVLHDLTLALQLADEALLIKDGCVEAAGDINDVLTPEKLTKVYEMDLCSYMVKNLKRWENIQNSSDKF